ncbi:MAG: ABC transporter permease [Acidimicrobiales bacterium]|jgi:ribose transport system permease protein
MTEMRGVRARAAEQLAKAGDTGTGAQVVGIIVLIVVLGAGIAIVHRNFLSRQNFSVLSYEVSTLAMIAMGQMVVLGSGAMDLSVGGVGGLVGVMAGWALVVSDFPVAAAVALAVVIGATCGFINGWLIGRLEFSGATAFLVTLATGTFYAGVTLGLTGAIPYYNLPRHFDALSDNAVGGVPWMFFVMLLIAAALWFVYAMTSIGTQNLALGGNPNAARLCGIRIRRVLVVTFIVSGCLAGIAAIFYTAQFGAAEPTLGTDWLLPSFAAPIIGGTALSGGRVSVVGTVLGAVFLAEVTDALVFLNVSAFWNTFVDGAVILFAITLDVVRRRISLSFLVNRSTTAGLRKVVYR